METTNNKTSSIVREQLPFFVRNDHETFISFMEAYYEYLEQSNTIPQFGKTIDRRNKLTTFFDVDKSSIDDFTEHLYDEFMLFFPKNVQASRETLLKNIKDFYRAKGTEKALRFILRAMFNKEAEVYYPKRDILHYSGSSWFVQQSLRIENIEVDGESTDNLSDIENFIGTKITGATSTAFATVERVDRFYDGGVQVDELIISSIDGTFDSDEVITATYNKSTGGTGSLQATVLGSYISTVTIAQAGNNYVSGTNIPVESSNGFGTGASLRITDVSDGNIAAITVVTGGAGFTTEDYISVVGGGGAGANAIVGTIDDGEGTHPNTYNIIIDTIGLEANTNVSNAVYSNIGNAISDANTTLENALGTFVFGPTGPILGVDVNEDGSGYTSQPTVSATSNSRVRSLGILGKMEIVDGGQNYTIGDIIEFDSTFGYGANAHVSNVDAALSDAINEVEFIANSGFVIGGFGYKQNNLPTTNVSTTTGNGANIMVRSILGEGEELAVTVGSIGEILEVSILASGSGYSEPPYLNLESYGDGTAQITPGIVQGLFSYPGRFITDRGHVSSFNYFQGKDYYQNYSYVVRIRESLVNYRDTLLNLNHPAGMKIFGEYMFKDETANIDVTTESSKRYIYFSSTYTYDNISNTITVTKDSHGLANNENVYIEFLDGYLMDNANSAYFTVNDVGTDNTFNTYYYQANTPNTSGNSSVGVIEPNYIEWWDANADFHFDFINVRAYYG